MKIAVVGTAGVPCRYGGFETLAEQIATYNQTHNRCETLTIYCSRMSSDLYPRTYRGAQLRYLSLSANGRQSVLYDALSIFDAVRHKADVIFLLGVSGALALPLVRLFCRSRIVTNLDGIEWRRDKWRGFAKWFLHISERIALKASHAVIADNQGIVEYLQQTYGVDAHLITYGGNHAVCDNPKVCRSDLPEHYMLGLCRIEPENNVETILRAFVGSQQNLVFVGNWSHSKYGRDLRNQFNAIDNIDLLDPVFSANELFQIRSGATAYVHGHSAGGTNPSLVEMMFIGKPIFAFDCCFNKYTTQNKAMFFTNDASLRALVSDFDEEAAKKVGENLRDIALANYDWGKICSAYFDLAEQVMPDRNHSFDRLNTVDMPQSGASFADPHH